MRKISTRGKKVNVEQKTVYLCKTVESDFLGREIYADDVETPYNFYLIRELNLAKDYQNLAEGEAYFDAICDSWDALQEFDQLVVKKIYIYVETELMYYTLFMGSFEPLDRESKMGLKEWLRSVKVPKETFALATQSADDSEELNSVVKQIMEASEEMFHLRKMMGDLSETINEAREEAKTHPLVSRSVHTIHLKRAQPLLEDNERMLEAPAKSFTAKRNEAPTLDGEYSEEEPADTNDRLSEHEEQEKETGKKLRRGLRQKPVQENTQPAEEIFDFPHEPKSELTLEEEDSFEERLKSKKSGRQLLRISDDLQEFATLETDIKQRRKAKDWQERLLSQLILKKHQTKKRTPSNWPRFSRLLKESQVISAPKKIPDFSRSEMESLEDEIYLRFMSKRMVIGKKNKDQKRWVSQIELQNQITKAEYLSYSWGQVLKQRKEDVLICNRLSSASLVNSMDDFLFDMRELANRPSVFKKRVKCSVEKLRKLEGYILLDQYMQKLSQIKKEDYK